MNPLVSVVVATYRRPGLLDRCIQALLAQNFPPNGYEIVIVDDDPGDGAARDLVRSWQQRLQMSYAFLVPPVVVPVQSSEIPVTGVTSSYEPLNAYKVSTGPYDCPKLTYLPAVHTQRPAAARNLGWRAAQGQIIAFTDDDCIPDANWLSHGLTAFVADVAAVSGRVIVPLPAHPTDHERNLTGLEQSDFVTANCFYRKDVLEAVGGFDERFRIAWREDSDLYFSVREQNHTLAWASGAVVVHPVRHEPWGSSLSAQRKSFYNALLFRKHPELYSRFIQPTPPWTYYAILAAALVAAAGMLMGSPLAAALGAAAWFGLTLRFALKRLANTSRAPSHVMEMLVTSVLIPFLSIYWRVRGAVHWRTFFL